MLDSLGISAKTRMSCAGTMTNSGRRSLSAIIRSRFTRLASASVSALRRVIQGRFSRCVIPSNCYATSPTNA